MIVPTELLDYVVYVCELSICAWLSASATMQIGYHNIGTRIPKLTNRYLLLFCFLILFNRSINNNLKRVIL